jgi:hypothetical protein
VTTSPDRRVRPVMSTPAEIERLSTYMVEHSPDRGLAQGPIVFLAQTGQNPHVVCLILVCAFCGKSVLRAGSEVEVREGENPFHLYCYLLYKRRRAAEEAEAAQ